LKFYKHDPSIYKIFLLLIFKFSSIGFQIHVHKLTLLITDCIYS